MLEIALADSEDEDDVEAYDFFDEPSTEEDFEAVMTEVQDLPESPSETNNEPKGLLFLLHCSLVIKNFLHRKNTMASFIKQSGVR